MQFQSKVPEQDGKPCQETGGKTGKATTTLMANPCPLRSQQVMAELWSPTMLPQLVGPLAKHSVELNSTSQNCFATWFKPMVLYSLFY